MRGFIVAKQMNFKSYSGIEYPDSYWLPVQIILDEETKTGEVIFNGYATVEDKKENKEPIGSRQYIVKPAMYDRLFTVARTEELRVAAAYVLADATLDVIGPSDKDSPAYMRSFFYGALDV
jgi:hypothetical protein